MPPHPRLRRRTRPCSKARWSVPGGRGIRELPAPGVSLPLGRIELDALEVILVYQLLELLEALHTLARVEGAIEDELVRVLLLQNRVLLSGVEAVGEEFGQVGRLEDRNVHVARLEEVVHHVLFGVLVVLLLRPDPFLGAQVLVVVVEAVDESLPVLVAVLGAGIPVVDVPIHHEILLAVFLVQSALLLFPHHDTPPSSSRTYRPILRSPVSRKTYLEHKGNGPARSKALWLPFAITSFPRLEAGPARFRSALRSAGDKRPGIAGQARSSFSRSSQYGLSIQMGSGVISS